MPKCSWPLWRRFIPIQSTEQFASCLIAYMVGVFASTFIIDWVGTHKTIPVLIGSLAGSSASLFATLPYEWRFSRSEKYFSRTNAEYILWRVLYEKIEYSTNFDLYRQRLPRFLRWKECDVTIQMMEDTVAINGPKFAVMRLYKKMRET
jgi:hypothetical protein